MPLQRPADNSKITGQPRQIHTCSTQKSSSPIPHAIKPFRQSPLVGVQPPRVAAQLTLIALGVELGERSRRLNRGRSDDKTCKHQPRTAQGPAQQNPRTHERSSPMAWNDAPRAVRKRRGRVTPAKRRIHIRPTANRATTTNSTI